MNKKLLIAAVGAALVAGPMVAAHAGATLYGRFHVSMDRQDNGADPAVEQGLVSNNTSRFGIKGDEDLGGGLKSIYQMESSFITDEGGGTLASRNTFVGLAGGMGTVKIGRHDTPYKELGYKTNRFIEQVGDARNVMGDGDAATNDGRAGFDSRPDNMLRYDSPSFGGAKFSYLYSNNNDEAGAAASDTGTAGQTWNSLSLTWTSGPLFLGAAWEEHGKTTSATATADESGIRLVGEYGFNDFTFGLFWESLSDLGGVSGTDADVLGIAAAFKFGNNTLKFHIFDRDKTDNATTANGSKMMSLGLDHALSKTTMFYVNYSSVDNDTAAVRAPQSSYAGHGENIGTTAGKKPVSYSAGMMVAF